MFTTQRSDDAALELAWQGEERSSGHRAVFVDELGQGLAADQVEQLTVGLCGTGELGHSGGDIRIDLGHARYQAVADSVSGVHELIVRWIVDGVPAVGFADRFGFGPGHIEQRSYELHFRVQRTFLGHSAQSVEAGASDDVHEHGLCLIVLGVRDGDGGSTAIFGELRQSDVPHVSGGRFKPFGGCCCLCGRVHFQTLEGQFRDFGEYLALLTKVLSSFGCLDSVIDVSSAESPAVTALRVGEEEQHC